MQDDMYGISKNMNAGVIVKAHVQETKEPRKK